MPSEEASPYRLLVEGEDDQHVISNLLHEPGVDNWRLDYQERTKVGPDQIAISYKKGVDPFLNDLEAELLPPGQECLGIVSTSTVRPRTCRGDCSLDGIAFSIGFGGRAPF